MSKYACFQEKVSLFKNLLGVFRDSYVSPRVSLVWFGAYFPFSVYLVCDFVPIPCFVLFVAGLTDPFAKVRTFETYIILVGVTQH